MNPEEDKQPPAPQNEPNQPAPEGPVVQDVVAPPDAQPQQSSANPEVKQPPEDQQNEPAPENPDAPEPAGSKSTVSLGGESAPLTEEEDASDSASPEDATAPTKPQKQPKAKPSSNLPIGFIAATVIMALVLMGLVVMMYMNQEAEAPVVPETTTPTSESAPNNDFSNNDAGGAEEETTAPDPSDEIVDDEPTEVDETDNELPDDPADDDIGTE